ncbi:MAG: GAF domain-containing protein [Anaeromyxobacter sp.]
MAGKPEGALLEVSRAPAGLAAEVDRLRARVRALEEENGQLGDALVEAMDRADELVQQVATLIRIHGAAQVEELLQAMQEVVIDVIGSGELGIYALQDGSLRLLRALGREGGGHPERIAMGQGTAGRVAAAGRPWVAARDGAPDPGEDELTACVPLLAEGRVVGLITIYRLLVHKPELREADLVVLELLAIHGGQALHLRRAAERAA